MGWFKGEDALTDEDVDLEEQRASVFRLSEEMHRLSEELLSRAQQLKRELESGRQPEGRRP